MRCQPGEHFGLYGQRERAEIVWIKLESGTAVEVIVPALSLTTFRRSRLEPLLRPTG